MTQQNDIGYVEDNADKVFNSYNNEESDWNPSQPQKVMEKSTEVYNDLIRPASKVSFQMFKGIDPDSGERKTGFGYSGFEEANNADLTTSNLKDDMNMGTSFVNSCNYALMDLAAIKEIYDIEVRPLYRLILYFRSMYTSTAKSVDATLLKALTTERSEQTVQRRETPNQTKQKKSGLFSFKGNEEEPTGYE